MIRRKKDWCRESRFSLRDADTAIKMEAQHSKVLSLWELAALNIDDIQIRQRHWAIVDLIGKGGHV